MIANMSYISSDSLCSIRFIYDSLASLALGMLCAFTLKDAANLFYFTFASLAVRKLLGSNFSDMATFY